MTAPTNLDRRGSTPAAPSDAAPGGRTGTGSAWLLVTRREIMVKATDRSFLIGTVVTLAIIAGIMVLQVVLAGRTSTYDVAVTPSATTIAQQVRAGAAAIDEDVVVDPLAVPDDAAARAAVLDGSADAWLHRDGDRWVLTTKDGPNDSLKAVVQEVVRSEALRANASAAGTTLEALERGATLGTAFLEGDAQRAELVDALAFAFTFLFYMAALMFGVTLANSVVEEKQSRVVEIIATAIPVRHLLAGKVLGNTVLAVAQMTLFVAVGLVGLAFTDYSSLVTSVSGPVVWFVVFFLAGFVSLACLWAVAGSLASRTEDLQSTTTPLTFLVMAVLFGGLLLEGQWQVIGSFVPPLSAVVMPIRLLQGDASWPEALLALAILLAAAAATVRVGERLYRRSLLQGGGRVTVRQAWRVEE
ncbi:ABC transporter permease [Kineosporia sp. A_224]|uniref:ABC transporter permease n=1 Tax=Kineosporia sp. A_224 TaxID=1962180 RepID=UPI000B4B5D24|nr:ABC transporter permease [Kineosporia sp. A_224]